MALKLRARWQRAQGGGAAETKAGRRGNAILPTRAPASFKRMLDGARCQIIGRSYEDAVSTASRCELTLICRQLCAEGMRAIVPLLFDPDQIIVRQVEVLQQMKHPNTLDDYRTVTRKARLNNR